MLAALVSIRMIDHSGCLDDLFLRHGSILRHRESRTIRHPPLSMQVPGSGQNKTGDTQSPLVRDKKKSASPVGLIPVSETGWRIRVTGQDENRHFARSRTPPVACSCIRYPYRLHCCCTRHHAGCETFRLPDRDNRSVPPSVLCSCWRTSPRQIPRRCRSYRICRADWPVSNRRFLSSRRHLRCTN